MPASSINSQFLDQPWSDSIKKKLDINEKAIDGLWSRRKESHKSRRHSTTGKATTTTITPRREIEDAPVLSEDDDDWVLTDHASSSSKSRLPEKVQNAVDNTRMEVARRGKLLGVGKMKDSVLERGKGVGKAAGRKWEEAKEGWDRGRVLWKVVEKAEKAIRERVEE